jgi:excinuclease ABC subunit A
MDIYASTTSLGGASVISGGYTTKYGFKVSDAGDLNATWDVGSAAPVSSDADGEEPDSEGASEGARGEGQGARDGNEIGSLFPGTGLKKTPDLISVAPVSTTLDQLRRRGFHRLFVNGKTVALDDVDPAELRSLASLQVIVDRVKLDGEELRTRLTDSIETAYREGGGAAFAIENGLSAEAPGAKAEKVHLFSERFECQDCAITYETPQPRLFSFNNPFGACPTCHGFGNVIELDLDLVVPDRAKTLRQGAVEPWTKPHYRAELATLKKEAKRLGVPLDTPWSEMTDAERQIVIDGDGGEFAGIRGFFAWLERKKYKVHVRVFLSRYRGYLTCPDCGGARLRRAQYLLETTDLPLTLVARNSGLGTPFVLEW